LVFLMAFAAIVSIAQLAVLSSWSRSLRITTLLQAIAVGFGVMAPITVLLEWLLTRAIAFVTRTPLHSVVDLATWAFDPVMEEVLRVSPLFLLAWLWPRVHRQLGFADHLLLGAALGAGCALAESALRYGQLWAGSTEVRGGYVVFGNMLGAVAVPSPLTSLLSWLPAPTSFGEGPGFGPASLMLWTALAAAGVGWVTKRAPLRLLGLAPLVLVGLVHANSNATATTSGAPWAWRGLNWVDDQLAIALPILLVALVLVDRFMLWRARARQPDTLLAGENSYGLNPIPLLRVGLSGPPWSAAVTWQLVLERRAALNACVAHSPDTALATALGPRITQLVQAATLRRWEQAAKQVFHAIGFRGLWSWRTVLWMASVTPAILFLVVGGFPLTRGLQQFASGWIGTGIILAGLAAGVVVIVSQLPGLIRRLRELTDPALHELRLRPTAQLANRVAALSVAMLLVMLLAITGRPAGAVVTNYHLLDALAQAEFWVGLALILLSFLYFPPGAAILVTTIGTRVLTLSGLTLLAGTAVGSSLILQAMLNAASTPSSSRSSGGGSQSGSGWTAADGESSAVGSGRFSEGDLPRLQGLARDPAHGGGISKGTWEEAEVGLGLEKKGEVRGLVRSTRPGEEFIDSSGQAWDVKAFRGDYFNLRSSVSKIQREVTAGENVMLDTRYLSEQQFVDLDEAINAAGLASKVLWWP
jgi:hypothetical protein